MTVSRSSRARFALVLAGGMLLLLVAVAAQSPGGASPPPNPLGNPLLETPEQVKEDAFYKVPRWPEDRKYADIEGMKMKAVLREAAAISRRDKARGTLFWGRNVGFQGHADTQDWVEGYFRRFGLQDIHRKRFDLPPQWMAKSFEVSFTSGGAHLVLKSARPAEDAPSTPPGGVEFDLVWVNTGTAADFVGRT